jgi:leucyl aminopeptidase
MRLKSQQKGQLMERSDSFFAPPTSRAIPINLVSEAELESWLKVQDPVVQNSASTHRWKAQLGQTLVVTENGNPTSVAIGIGNTQSRSRKRFGALAGLSSLPTGIFKLTPLNMEFAQDFTLGFAMSKYQFNRYNQQSELKAELICPNELDANHIQAIVAGEFLTRDLINTPPNDMGPEELEEAAQDLGKKYDAIINVILGDALVEENFPMIHAVGRASHREPRLIDMKWGNKGPRITLVGKGVCFDTGGLNIKPGISMGLMKKDMGGAAHVLGLAKMIMSTQMKVQLRILIPAVENAIGSDAFRPQDILTSRKGLTVEVNNTDAEGRLVLADALTFADEIPTDLIICMATLTGAARVAVGPDIAPYFTSNVALSQSIAKAGTIVDDPVWQLPLHIPYEAMIEPGIADLDNAPRGGFAGAITAALFLNRFVTNTSKFVHFDCYGWQPTGSPASPKGGTGQGIRALFQALPEILDL